MTNGTTKPGLHAVQAAQRPNLTLEFIRVGDMTPDHDYQRDRKQSKVDHLAKTWADHRIGALIVNRRKSGKVRISDGGHRWEAARKRFGDDYLLPCVVNDDLSNQDEADVFIGVNRDRTAVGKWDEYQVGLKGGHQPYVGIETTLKQRGLGAAQKASPNRVGAVQALLRIEKAWGLNVLGDTVDTLGDAFGHEATTWDADMMQATARLIGINPHVDLVRLTKILQKRSVALWRLKSQDKPGGSESRSITMAKVIAQDYNSRLQKANYISAIK